MNFDKYLEGKLVDPEEKIPGSKAKDFTFKNIVDELLEDRSGDDLLDPYDGMWLRRSDQEELVSLDTDQERISFLKKKWPRVIRLYKGGKAEKIVNEHKIDIINEIIKYYMKHKITE